VHDKARVLGQPGLNVRVGVGGVSVHDQMQLQVLGRAALDQPQELEPLFMSVLRPCGELYRRLSKARRDARRSATGHMPQSLISFVVVGFLRRRGSSAPLCEVPRRFTPGRQGELTPDNADAQALVLPMRGRPRSHRRTVRSAPAGVGPITSGRCARIISYS
jgi:hypothetical protein